ncbi:hypothetical protein ACJQWK_04494 [Exserohilum turcicum]
MHQTASLHTWRPRAVIVLLFLHGCRATLLTVSSPEAKPVPRIHGRHAMPEAGRRPHEQLLFLPRRHLDKCVQQPAVGALAMARVDIGATPPMPLVGRRSSALHKVPVPALRHGFSCYLRLPER